MAFERGECAPAYLFAVFISCFSLQIVPKWLISLFSLLNNNTNKIVVAVVVAAIVQYLRDSQSRNLLQYQGEVKRQHTHLFSMTFTIQASRVVATICLSWMKALSFILYVSHMQNVHSAGLSPPITSN